MGNLWLNVRFGSRYLQIGPGVFRFGRNPFWERRPPDKWFQVYQIGPWSFQGRR